MKTAFRLAATTLVLSALAIAQVNYNFETVDYPGSSRTRVTSINSHGQASGDYRLPGSFADHGFIRGSDGAFTTVDFPGASQTLATSINDLGQVVGTYALDGNFHGFYYRSGEYVAFDYPGASNSISGGINNLGTIVGTYQMADGIFHGFILRNRVFSAIDVPGAVNSVASGISASGEITGSWDTGNQATNHSFTLINGQFTTFDYPGVPEQRAAFGVSATGNVVGFYVDAVEDAHGFLRSPNGEVTSTEVPGAFWTIARGVNGRGQIVGNRIIAGVGNKALSPRPVESESQHSGSVLSVGRPLPFTMDALLT